MTFENLNLTAPVLKALAEEGYQTPTPIQQQAIPVVLEGRDLLGCAQTGTGKTAAFAIPTLEILARNPAKNTRRIRALVLTPTRELAAQIGDSFKAYGRYAGLRYTVIFGGVGQKTHTDALQRGVDILVATPGRLLDLMNQGYVNLNHLELFVLDEADRMLDMGFIHDVKRVISKLPHQRQTLMFSATMPNDISQLAASILKNPARVEVTPVSSTVDTITQKVYFVDRAQKRNLLHHILQDEAIKSVLVFARTKYGADKVARDIQKAGIRAEAIHGDKTQGARVKALSGFKTGQLRVLVATDIAARGIDVDELSHVINYDLPNVPETYVHRIGRTGRAGLDGVALSFCDHEEKAYLRDIHKLISKTLTVVDDHPYPMSAVAPEKPAGVPNGQPRRDFRHRMNSGQAKSSARRFGGPSRQGGGRSGGPGAPSGPSRG